MKPRVVLCWSLLMLAGAGLGTPSAHAQCAVELAPGETVLSTTGTGVRLAVDPVDETPVALWQDTSQNAIVYRRFYGPAWGPTVTVDTGGQLLPMVLTGENAGLYIGAMDFVLDDHGRPRVALANEAGVFHTRYTSGWSTLETLMTVSLGELLMGAISLRLERDPAERVHLLFWTEAWSSGTTRSYHLYDDTTGFTAAHQFDSGGWKPRAAPTASGDMHVVSFRLYPDPASDHGQYQATYWHWTQAGGWPADAVQITHEPNPPVKINNAGPVGFQPDVVLDPDDVPHVVYPAHYDDATNGEIRYIHLETGTWTDPSVPLFAANGHAGRPLLAIDRHGTKLALCLVYGKRWAADVGDGSGFGADDLWHPDGGHWLFHDLVETRGVFWLAYVAASRQQQGVGNVEVKRFVKTGLCPGVSPDDLDDDDVPDDVDLCPGVPDPAQGDADGDGIGDLCDTDDDDDGIPDETDVCPRVPDPGQADSDGDGLGDACSNLVDADGDGVLAPWDCDDANPAAFPGNPEVCDGADNDCDGQGDPPSCDPTNPDATAPPGDSGPTPDGGTQGNGVSSGCSCGTPAPRPAPLPWLLLVLWLGFRRSSDEME